MLYLTKIYTTRGQLMWKWREGIKNGNRNNDPGETAGIVP
jgi:hypothetical protein